MVLDAITQISQSVVTKMETNVARDCNERKQEIGHPMPDDASAQPNVLFIMTDQQRFDTIASLGNSDIYTPNIDRLVRRGAAFTNAYSTTPVCIPARYTIRTGCEAPSTGIGMSSPKEYFQNQGQLHADIEMRCGPYLASTMGMLGYRTFGVGKFHTLPWGAPVGFDIQLNSEEYYIADDRPRDAYVSFLTKEHPEYAWIESLHGERTEMYYMPQRSPLPAHLTVEAWAADQTVELVNVNDDRPWFGFVSFIGPHPPFAPPQPFNRIYNPDRMPQPVCGEKSVDHMDQYLPYMNHKIWADEITDSHARVLKARYYGEITYIDYCIGKILDSIEDREDSDNTVICFFSDHGEHLGDHHSWQKESFFESSARIPFLVSWPRKIPICTRSDLVCLTDLFGIATSVAGFPELREGGDVVGALTASQGNGSVRNTLFGYYGEPGTWKFKLMVRRGQWKLIYFANGGLTQLYNVEEDGQELKEMSDRHGDVVESLIEAAVEELERRGCINALEGGKLREVPFRSCSDLLTEERSRAKQAAPNRNPSSRIHQFDPCDRVRGFPDHPLEVLDTFSWNAN